MKRILIIGPAPQNIGGISIHIRRLVHLLNNDYSFDFVDEGRKKYDDVFNLRSMNFVTYLKKILRANIIHIHSGNFSLRAMQIFICKIIFRKYTVVTVHRDPNREGRVSVTKFLLGLCDKVIMVNQEGFIAVYKKSINKYYMLPAFLPPVMEEEETLPEEIVKWITQARRDINSKLLVSNAFKMVLHKGNDLYGLDLCIDAMIELHKVDINHIFYLVFVIADNCDQKELVSSYKRKIMDNSLSQYIKIWESPLSFVRLIQLSDIVLRATNTDGDALSVREGLYFGKKVIASNVVKRPDGTYLFKSRNAQNLSSVILNVVNSDINTSYQIEDYRKTYMKIYN